MFRNLLDSIDKKEWRLIFYLTIFVILLTTLPYIYGWLQTPKGFTYTGLHSLTPGDTHVYFSWMEQVKQGHFVSKDLYTSEPQKRILLNSFWSVEGLLAKWSGLSNNLIFQLSRIALIPYFIILLYLLSAYIFKDKLWRKINFIFLLFASGAGVAISIILPDSVYARGWYNWPLDLWAPESNNLLTMFQSPHLILSTSLIILILWLAFLAFEKNNWRYSLLAGCLALAELQFHPFHAPTIFGVLGAYFIVQLIINFTRLKERQGFLFRIVKHTLIILLISLPSILYWLWMELTDFTTQIRTYQNVCLTPSLWVSLVSYGFLIPLALWAIYKFIRTYKLNNLKIFLITWFIIQFILLYAPFLFQRRLMQGLQIPLIILAVYGLRFIYNYFQTHWSVKKFNFYIKNIFLMLILFVLLFTSSNIYNWIREMTVFAKTYPQLYINNDVLAGYNWFAKYTRPNSVILADLYNGNLIPGRTGRRVYIGHGVETLFFDSKLQQLVWFYATNKLDEKKKKFLKQNHIDYIFYSSNERGIGDFRPQDKPYLEKVFQQGQTEIYKVK